jgi:spore germination protein
MAFLAAALAAAALVTAPPPHVFAFVSHQDGRELRRLARVGARVDVVAPNWYALDAASGRLAGPHDRDPLLRIARRRGVRVWPVVNVRTGGAAWNGDGVVRALVSVARTRGVAGVTLDMEELRPDQRAAFTALVRRAARRVHRNGRQLAVYVPRTGAAYNWRALARTADLVLASGYNEHWGGGPPGPITTSRGFAAVARRSARAGAVPLIGAFGYRWPEGELIATVDAERLRRRLGKEGVHADGSVRFRAGDDTIVYESAAGMRARVDAARAAGARWVGLFSLGREPARFWRGLKTAR